MYNVGSLATNKQRLASTYDTRACIALARELAGIADKESVTSVTGGRR